MIEPWTLVDTLAANNSRKSKETILLKAAEEDCEEFFLGARLAMDALITFGVKQVPEKSTNDGQGLPWRVFKHLADQLAERTLTGHDARDAIDLAMQVATQAQWNSWYRRILIKDLRCGVTEKSINKVVKKSHSQFLIPTFDCQLAHSVDDHESKLTGKKFIQCKLDGVRVLTILYTSGHVAQYSRNGHELVNFPHIKAEFATLAKQITEPMVFDGEVMSASFQDLMRQVHRKTDVNAGDATLYVFDWLTLHEFRAGKSSRGQRERSESLIDFFAANDCRNIQTLSYLEVDMDTKEGQRQFNVANSDFIRDGFEGVMIKNPEAPYECKRTASWLKMKPFIQLTLTVKAVEEGTGRNEGRLGAFVCEGHDEGRDIRVNVGSGFSDSDRDSFWAAKNKVVGHLAEVRADAVTQNQDGSYSLRFPRFITFRDFVAGEKI